MGPKGKSRAFIDFHIAVQPDLTVEEVHDLIGCLKKEMWEVLKNTRVNVHVDPIRAAEPSQPAMPDEQCGN